jgi:hypothetical protein
MALGKTAVEYRKVGKYSFLNRLSMAQWIRTEMESLRNYCGFNPHQNQAEKPTGR